MAKVPVSCLTPAVLAAALLVSSSTSFALPNAGFAQDLQGWDSTAAASWSPQDADESASSGSVQIEVESLGSAAITACIPVTASDIYEFGVAVLLDIPNNTQGRAGLVVRWTSDAACENGLDGFPPNTFTTVAPQWQAVSASATAPSGAVAALIELRASKTGGNSGASVTANLDNAFFSPVGSLPIGQCADPAEPFDLVTASDALFVLRSSVGILSCAPCQCDANGSGSATASDALSVLRFAVGHEVILNCPDCS